MSRLSSIAVPRVVGRTNRQVVAVRQRQEVEEVARGEQRVDVILEGDVGDAGLGGVRHRSAKLLLGHHFVGDGLHDLGTGDEHVGAVLHHEDEVGHRRRIDRAARARSHDQADLRDDSGRQHVALEHLGIAAEGGDAFLDSSAAGIVQADERRADLHRHVHHLADFLRVALRQRSAEHGEILGEDIDEAAVDGARSGDDSVARDLLRLHSEVSAIVLDEHVIFFEASRIEQDGQPLACGEPTLGMLRCNALFAAAELRKLTPFLQFFDRRGHAFPSGGADSCPSFHGWAGVVNRCPQTAATHNNENLSRHGLRAELRRLSAR